MLQINVNKFENILNPDTQLNQVFFKVNKYCMKPNKINYLNKITFYHNYYLGGQNETNSNCLTIANSGPARDGGIAVNLKYLRSP